MEAAFNTLDFTTENFQRFLPMSSDKPNEPKQITVTFPDGKIASAITRLVVGKKPIGWGRRSNSPYYTKEYGEWVKAILDSMMASGRPQCVEYSSFKNTKQSTVYLKINQGLLYLLEELDVDGKYKAFRAKIHIFRREKIGVLFEFRVEEGELPPSTEVVSVKAKPRWKRQIDEYLENPNPHGQPLHITNLALTDEEVAQQTLELDGLGNIMYVVNNHEIKIIKGV